MLKKINVFYLLFYGKILIGDMMQLDYNGTLYNVLIIKKNNKNLYIRVDDELNIKVTCPYFYTKKMIKKMLEDNVLSIYKMIDKQKYKNDLKKKDDNSYLGDPLNVIYKTVKKPLYDGKTLVIENDDMLLKWYKNMSKEVFKTYLDEAYYVFDEKIPYPKLKIRQMKTRWGVCNRKDNSVTLNLDLIKKDKECLNYVIVHELSHFVHFNHSKEFWRTVEKYCPDYKRVRKELKK